MASDDEDVDLQALRSAVLASLKTKTQKVEKPKDEDELEHLRQAALHSKKIETQEIPSFRPFHKFQFGRRLPIHHHNHMRPHNNKFSWMKPANCNSNLITIQTVPLESDDTGRPPHKFSPVNKFHRPFHPQGPQLPRNRILVPENEASSSPKVKQKSNDKFSRFESDSDSDDDSEFNFPLNSSDSDGNISSTTADDNRTDAGTTTVDVSEVDDHSNMNDESLDCRSSDKENEDSKSVCSEKETAESSNGANLLTNSKPEEVRSDVGGVEIQNCVAGASDADNCGSSSEACNKKSGDVSAPCTNPAAVIATELTNGMVKRIDKNDDAESEHTNSDNLSSGDKLRTNGVNKDSRFSPVLSDSATREKLEARRRKFESKPIIQPKNTKISLRDIVQSVQDNELNCKELVEKVSSPLRTTHCQPSQTVAKDVFSDSDSDGSDSSERRQCKRFQTTRPKHQLSATASDSVPSKLSRQTFALTDKEQDLRVSLRLKRQERLQQRNFHSSGSGSSDESSLSDSCSSPIIKSVLSVVKVESRNSDRTRESSPSIRHQRTTKDDESFTRRHPPTTVPESRHEKNRRTRPKRREPRRSGWINSKLSEDAVVKDGHPENASSSSTKQKLPVRMRLGLPVTSSSSVSTEPKEAKKRRSASPSQTLSVVEPKIKRQSSKGSWQKERSSKSSHKSGKREARVVRVAKKFSNADNLESTGKGALACDGDLDQRIRRIQERNEAIMRRQEEIIADRKKYS